MGGFDDIEARQIERQFTVQYPDPDLEEQLRTDVGQACYTAVVATSLHWVDEGSVPWIEVRHGSWSRVFRPGMVWATGSGIVLRRRGCRLKPGATLEAFFAEAPGFDTTPWCWYFAPGLGAMDGLAHKYLGWGLRSTIARYFEHVETFDFHAHALKPNIPDWLDAEYFPERHAIALYGDNGADTRP